MSKNMFTVDLGDLDLTHEQRTNIINSILRSVSGELASVGSAAGKIIVIPVHNWKGPIINGLIARKVTDDIINNIIKE